MKQKKILKYISIYILGLLSSYLLIPIGFQIFNNLNKIPNTVTKQIVISSILFFDTQANNKVSIQKLINNGYLENIEYLKDNNCNIQNSYINKTLEKQITKYNLVLYCVDKKAELTMSRT